MNKIVLSFCIYGNNIKYLKGLECNLKIINELLPDFHCYIYVGNDVLEEWVQIYSKYNNVNITRLDITGEEINFYRIFAIDNDDVSVLFSRNTDSRINYRDIYLMNEFIQSPNLFHVIRDNYCHTNRVIGCAFGIKKMQVNIKTEIESWKNFNNITKFDYNSHERFLIEKIYPMLKNNSLIHTNIIGYIDENTTSIDCGLKESTDFVGNVVDFREDGTEYYIFNYHDILLGNLIDFLYGQNQWRIMTHIYTDNCFAEKIKQLSDNSLYYMYIAHYYCGQYDKCVDVLRNFEYRTVTEHIIINSNFLFEKLSKNIIGTTDINREPKENEIVIYYGNYHYSIDALPVKNKVYRHAKFYTAINHTAFEFHECWNEIDIIYLLNLEVRKDRYLEALVELCKMNAPLNKIHHFVVEKKNTSNNSTADLHYDVCNNHVLMINHFIAKGYNNCLILEDDITFTNRVDKHKADLLEFFKRKYDFDLCFIASSNYGTVLPKDDLVRISHQECTTTSGYLLNKGSAAKIRDVLQEGNQKLIKTGEHWIYAADRYWHKLQSDNKFLLFNDKFGYQRPSYSSITHKFSCHFD